MSFAPKCPKKSSRIDLIQDWLQSAEYRKDLSTPPPSTQPIPLPNDRLHSKKVKNIFLKVQDGKSGDEGDHVKFNRLKRPKIDLESSPKSKKSKWPKIDLVSSPKSKKSSKQPKTNLESSPKSKKSSKQSKTNLESSPKLLKSPNPNPSISTQHNSLILSNESKSYGNSSLLPTFANHLNSGYFRFINEQLYTHRGDDCFELFKKEPELFTAYHEGYAQQVEKWPYDPLDHVIRWIKTQPKSAVIADFGCGKARLAQTFPHRKIYSFDFVSHHPSVTACDISHVPINDNMIDIGIFCLSLMGTNFVDYLVEAHRVMKVNASLRIVEVKSRIQDMDIFFRSLLPLGWKLKHSDSKDKMFVHIWCKKLPKIEKINLDLAPCLYKRR